jgi:glycosyltransferase involved in cell wall biosynthesis
LRSVRASKADLRVISFGSERPTAELQLPEGAEFYFCPRQDRIRDLYAQCDVWITASRSEGFNLPALEAMACRTPVVATRTGWPEEAVKTGLNGILVDVGDVVQTAQGVEWVLSRSDEEWRKLSANAHETAAQGSWEESAKLFEKALQHACQRSRRGEISGNCFSTEREPSSQNAEQHSDGRRWGSH